MQALLYAIPLVTLILVSTNELHHLFWGQIRLEASSPGGSGIGAYQHRVWFWVQVTYSYVLVLAGGFILIQALLQYPNRYRWRAVPLLLAALAPLTGNALYSFGFRPAGGVNLTALAFSVTAVCVAESIARFDFFRVSPALLPVAHETLFEQMRDLVFAVDVDQRVVWANRAAAAALGAADGQLAGRPLAEVIPEVVSITLPRPEDGRGGPLEVSLRVGGAQLTYDIAVTPLRLRPNEDLGRLMVFRDITERRRAELALRESEQKLRQSQRMEAIGRLAGGIAHDFNNLLTVILGYGEVMLLDEGLSDSLRHDLDQIRQAAEKAQGLTAQILAFSRKQPREVKAIAPDRVIEDMTALLVRTLGEDVALELALAARGAVVEADPDQLTQILTNLALNARDAMPQGGTLTVETATLSSEWWRVRVTDTGTGIDEALLPHMFEPFFTTKGQSRGTGLGLATVYGIVKQSNGDITVSSKAGEGTTFEIILPLRKQLEEPGKDAPAGTVASTEAAYRSESGAKPAEPARRPHAPVILLVEDEPGVRELAARTLRDAGYCVLEAADGPEALAIADDPKTQLDLLLTDIVLPHGLRGDEVATAVCTERVGTKVLFVSGYPKDSVIFAEHKAAGAYYLNKPYSLQVLAGKVREILNY